MATNQEQLAQARKAAAQRQKDLDKQRKALQVQQALTKRQLLGKSLQQRQQQKAAAQKVQRQRAVKLAQLKKYEETVLKPFEAQIAKAEAAQKAQASAAARQAAIIDRMIRGRPPEPGTLKEAERLLQKYPELKKIVTGARAIDPRVAAARMQEIQQEFALPPAQQVIPLDPIKLGVTISPIQIKAPVQYGPIEPAVGYKVQGAWETFKGKIRSVTGLDKPPTVTPSQVAAWETFKETVRDIGGPVVAAASIPPISAADPKIPDYVSIQPWLDTPFQVSVPTPDISQIDPTVPKYYVPEGYRYDYEALSPTQKRAIIAPPIPRQPILTREDIEKGIRKVADIPFYETTLGGVVGAVTEAPLFGVGPTVGEVGVVVTKAVEDILDFSAAGWEDLYDRTYGKIKVQPMTWKGQGTKPKRGTLEWKQAIVKGTLVPVITGERVGKYISTLGRITTYAIPYVGVTYMASEAAAGVQEYKHPEKEANKIFKDYYKEYLAGVKEAQKDLREGEYLETKTEEELKAQVMPQIISQVKGEGMFEAAIGLAFLGGVGAIKAGPAAFRYIPRTKYGRLSQKEYIEASKIVQKDLIALEKKPIKWVSISEKGEGVIELKGFQKHKGLEKEFIIKGTLEKTKKGAIFLPVARGESRVSGKIKFKDESIGYLEEQLFEVGAKGKSKLVGTIGDIQVYSQIGKTTTIPRAQTFALYKEPLKEEGIIGQFERQRTFGGEPLVDISEQIAFRVKPGVYLVKGKKEIGLALVKPKPSKGISFMEIPAEIKRTPFAKTFAPEAALIQKIPLKVKTIIPPKLIPAAPKPVSLKDGLPYMVGGTGLEIGRPLGFVSAAPFPSVEVVQISPIMKYPIKEPAILIPKLRVFERLDVIGVQKDFLKEATRLRDATLFKDAAILKERTLEAIRPIELPRFQVGILPVTKAKVIPRVTQVFRQVPIQVPRVIPRVVPRLRPTPRPTPRLRPPRLLIKFPLIIPSRLKPPRPPIPIFKRQIAPPGYNYEVRRRGKWVRARNPFAFATEGGAEAHAQAAVLKSAAASYRVVKAKAGRRVIKTGKKLRPKDQFLFRKGKEGIMIQKKRFRILSPGEKWEISYVGAAAVRKKAKLKKKVKTKKKKGGKR